MTARQDLGALVVHIEGSSGNLEMALKRSEKSLADFHSTVANSGFADLGEKEAAAMEQSMKEVIAIRKKALEEFDTKQLQEELFRNKASDVQIALKQMSEHYDAFRQRYAGNEKMLSLITEAEEAKREQIRKAHLIASEAHFRWMMRQVIRTSIYAYALSSVFRGVADSIKTWRTTKDPSETLLAAAKSLPAIGRVVEGFALMMGELNGTTVFKENMEALAKSSEQIFDIKRNLENQLELLKAINDEEKDRIKIRQEYEGNILDISKSGNEEAVKKRMEDLQGQIAKKKADIETSQKYRLVVSEYAITKEYLLLNEELAKTEELYKKIKEAKGLAEEKRQFQLQEQVKKEQEEIDKKREAAEKPVKDMIADLEKQHKLFGKTAGEVAAIEASYLGANAYVQKFIKAETDLLEVRKKNAEASATIKSLQEEKTLFGLEGAELAVAEARLKGYNSEKIEQIRLLAEELDSMKEKKRIQDELEQKQKAEYDNISEIIKTNKQKAEEEIASIKNNKKLMDLITSTPGAVERVNKYLRDKYEDKKEDVSTGQSITYDPRYISSAALSQSVAQQQLAIQKKIAQNTERIGIY